MLLAAIDIDVDFIPGHLQPQGMVGCWTAVVTKQYYPLLDSTGFHV